MAEEKSLINIEKGFSEVVKKRYVERFADDAIELIEEYKKIERAYLKYGQWVTALENEEDIPKVIAEYKKTRQELEDVDGYEL